MIEYIYGERCSGKTTEILNAINDTEEIGIVVQDNRHGEVFKSKIGRKRNIRILTKPHHAYGGNFDKVYIDDASYFDWQEFMPMLRDSMNARGGDTYVYFTIPRGFNSIRMLKKEKV